MLSKPPGGLHLPPTQNALLFSALYYIYFGSLLVFLL